jgi:sorting nexin-8
VDAYDLILNSGDRVGSGVGLSSIREILSSSNLTASDQGKILNLVVSGDNETSGGLGRAEFNVLLALIGLAQEGEDLSFDAVDDHRKSKSFASHRNSGFLVELCLIISCPCDRHVLTHISTELPQPHSGFLDRLRSPSHDTSDGPANERPTTPPPQPSPLQEPNSARSRQSRRESLGGLESDPWASPELHRNHAHATVTSAVTSEQRIINGYGSMRSTTNAWTSKPVEEPAQLGLSQEPTSVPPEPVEPSSSGSGWGGNFGAPGPSGDDAPFPSASRPALGGFGPPADDPIEPAPRRRSLGIARTTNPNVEETVTITLLPEKEGMFMFQHRNYEVKSARRGSTVVRRYSDFVWLLDCLQKRFPFRQLPLLPPKRVSGMSLC